MRGSATGLIALCVGLFGCASGDDGSQEGDGAEASATDEPIGQVSESSTMTAGDAIEALPQEEAEGPNETRDDWGGYVGIGLGSAAGVAVVLGAFTGFGWTIHPGLELAGAGIGGVCGAALGKYGERNWNLDPFPKYLPGSAEGAVRGHLPIPPPASASPSANDVIGHGVPDDGDAEYGIPIGDYYNGGRSTPEAGAPASPEPAPEPPSDDEGPGPGGGGGGEELSLR